MAGQRTVLTPENIALHLELAGLGTRFAALCIDLALLLSALSAIGLVGVIVMAAFQQVGLADIWLAVLILTVFVVFFGYFILFETLWNGQTPGKRVLGLRVILDGGFPVTVWAAAIRNLIRLVDFLPGFFGVGAVAVFANTERKRLGDLAAGTLVIRERSLETLRHGPEGPRQVRAAHLDALALLPSVQASLHTLTAAEVALLRRFALQRWQMSDDGAEVFAYRLVAPLAGRLNIAFDPDAPPCYADLACVIAREADRSGPDQLDFG